MLWSDEAKIELFGRNLKNHVWRENGAAFAPKKSVVSS